MKKIQLILLFSLIIPYQSYASDSSEIKVSAKILSGCNMNILNFNFGEIKTKDLSQSLNYDDKKIIVTNDINFSCSKGTIVTLSQSGLINSSKSGYSSNLLSLNGTGLFQANNVINYKFLTDQIISNEHLSIIHRPASERLGSINSGFDFTLSFKVLNGGNFSFPLTASLLHSYGYLQTTGNYSDTATFHISF